MWSLSFLHFVFKLCQRDLNKAKWPKDPRKWSANPLLHTHKILPLDCAVHDGTTLVMKALETGDPLHKPNICFSLDVKGILKLLIVRAQIIDS